MQGPLPVAWKALTQLDLLSLGLNKLTGTLPHAWAKLTGLTILYLGENAFTGEAPAVLCGLASVHACATPLPTAVRPGTLPKSWGKGLGAKLRDFQAANNQLSGTIPPEFGALSGLQIAALANNSGLTGCLPVQWKAQVHQQRALMSDGLAALAVCLPALPVACTQPHRLSAPLRCVQVNQPESGFSLTDLTAGTQLAGFCDSQ